MNDDFDATRTKPSYFVFLGTKVSVKSYADMLIKFMDILYDLDNATLNKLANENYKLPNATRVYITNDSSVLRKSAELQETGIYVEINLSANNIISFMKNLLDIYELDFAELIISVEK